MASIEETFAPFTSFDRSDAEKGGVGKVPCLVLNGVDKNGIMCLLSLVKPLLTLSPGELIYHHRSGQTTVDANAQPIQKDSLFKIASCSKLVTAIAVLQCIERGLITLDEPVYGVLPELSALLVSTESGSEKPQNAITLRNMLTHSSGMVYASQPLLSSPC